MLLSNEWIDYECLSAGNGEKLERWGNVILRRPDPQAMWPIKNSELWNNIDAFYHRSNKGGGYWDYKTKLPDYWIIKYKDLKFKVSPTNFKHTGLFPEQAANWDFSINKIKNSKRKIKVLNLFAYTGGATMAASYAGADVVHVDASKGMVEWAKENMKLCGLENNKIRFIVDDCLKFVQREFRRENKYDVIIMDPPSYGRGPNKEVWRLEDNLKELLDKAKDVLDPNYSFLLINSYTTGVSPISLNNLLSLTFNNTNVETGEIGLPVTKNNLILPCGIYGKVTRK